MLESEMSDSTEHQLPEEVVAEIRKRSAQSLSIPQTVDQAILTDAGEVLQRITKPKRQHTGRKQWLVGLLTVGSLAATLLIAMVTQWNHAGPVPSQEFARTAPARTDAMPSFDTATSDLTAATAAADVDEDGRIDILDAFALARRIRTTKTELINGDQNGDGVVDGADVDLIAMTAVTL